MAHEHKKPTPPPMKVDGRWVTHPNNALLQIPSDDALLEVVKSFNELTDSHGTQQEPCPIEADCPLCWSVRALAESDRFRDMVMGLLVTAYGPLAAIALNPKGAFMMAYVFMEMGRRIERLEKTPGVAVDDLEKLLALPDTREQANQQPNPEPKKDL